jgi:hypothetical protein
VLVTSSDLELRGGSGARTRTVSSGMTKASSKPSDVAREPLTLAVLNHVAARGRGVEALVISSGIQLRNDAAGTRFAGRSPSLVAIHASGVHDDDSSATPQPSRAAECARDRALPARRTRTKSPADLSAQRADASAAATSHRDWLTDAAVVSSDAPQWNDSHRVLLMR